MCSEGHWSQVALLLIPPECMITLSSCDENFTMLLSWLDIVWLLVTISRTVLNISCEKTLALCTSFHLW